MGFDWKLVEHLIDRLSITPDHVVLDPFCGAGTTLVQCKKRGISAVGIDANPVCTLASRVKTAWHLQPAKLEKLLDAILDSAAIIQARKSPERDPALLYLIETGMIDRGWLSLHKATKVMALRAAIQNTSMQPAERRFFNLALISALVSRIADIKFGPEVYCLPRPKKHAVNKSFVELVESMIDDIEPARDLIRDRASPKTTVLLGDSRNVKVLRQAVPNGADFVITSPPYPNEHDYTRSTRLELIMLNHVQDPSDLRVLKHRMLRCNTKGIYKADTDSRFASRYPAVQKIARTLDELGRTHADRFSQLYGRMVREYFGGMVSHLRSTINALRPGGRCAYVLRDQKSLLGVYLDTPAMVSALATSRAQGFHLEEIIEWKKIRGSTGNRTLKEKILILRKPSR